MELSLDPLPSVPEDADKHEELATIRENFQFELIHTKFPKRHAENILDSYRKFEDEVHLKQLSNYILKVHQDFTNQKSDIKDAEIVLWRQQGQYLIEKEKIDASFELREAIKLKYCLLFEEIPDQFVDKFGLLQMSDLLPDLIRQYLDFRYNRDLDKCEETKPQKKFKPKKTIPKEPLVITPISSTYFDPSFRSEKEGKATLKLIPDHVVFKNCEPGQTYKKCVKILNASHSIQSVSMKALPVLPQFHAEVDINSKIAPGMSVNATITYMPNIYRRERDVVTFKSNDGFVVSLPIRSTRENPRLIACIIKSGKTLQDLIHPGKPTFMEGRQRALNSTIDCGSCFLGFYVVLTVFVQNKGMRGTFFIITEDDWYFQEVASNTYNFELYAKEFWIYPTYFQVDRNEIMEIHIIFQPRVHGMHTGNYMIMCDNNSSSQIEILGDGLLFTKSYISIDILPHDIEIETKENYVLYYGDVKKGTVLHLIVTVHNRSSIGLNCKWNFENKPINKDIHDINESWITWTQSPTHLPPYSTSDFKFDIRLDESEAYGYHSIFLSFFILNIPEVCLEASEEFIVCQHIDDENDEVAQDEIDYKIEDNEEVEEEEEQEEEVQEKEIVTFDVDDSISVESNNEDFFNEVFHEEEESYAEPTCTRKTIFNTLDIRMIEFEVAAYLEKETKIEQM